MYKPKRQREALTDFREEPVFRDRDLEIFVAVIREQQKHNTREDGGDVGPYPGEHNTSSPHYKTTYSISRAQHKNQDHRSITIPWTVSLHKVLQQ